MNSEDISRKSPIKNSVGDKILRSNKMYLIKYSFSLRGRILHQKLKRKNVSYSYLVPEY